MRYAVVLLLVFLPFAGCTSDEQEPSPKRLHPRYTMTSSDLEQMTVNLPSEIRETISQRPEYFLQLVLFLMSEPEETYYLVDKEHELSSHYQPADLVNLFDYPITITRDTLQLRSSILPDTLAMVEAARQENIELVFSSTYRSYSYQEKVYARNVAELGEEQADRESAKPGKSQHQLGTVVDFGSITDAFAVHPAGIWLAEHGWEFGFSLSYPDGLEGITGYKYEPWHFRYIGRKGAELEHQFFSGIQHYFLRFLHDHRGTLAGYLEDAPLS